MRLLLSTDFALRVLLLRARGGPVSVERLAGELGVTRTRRGAHDAFYAALDRRTLAECCSAGA